jgi:hypothetical protein
MFRVEDVSPEEADIVFEKCLPSGSLSGPKDDLLMLGFQNE